MPLGARGLIKNNKQPFFINPFINPFKN